MSLRINFLVLIFVVIPSRAIPDNMDGKILGLNFRDFYDYRLTI